jgi:hypothetical protein
MGDLPCLLMTFQGYLELRACVLNHNLGLANFSYKRQIITILGSVGHQLQLLNSLMPYKSRHSWYVNDVCLCVPIKLYI